MEFNDDDFTGDTRSWVWDLYGEEPPTEELRAVRPLRGTYAFAVRKIKYQPYFGEIPMPIITKVNPCSAEENRDRQYISDLKKSMSARIRDAARRQEEGAAATSVLRKSMSAAVEVKRKCENCEYDAERISASAAIYTPVTCQTCSLNQYFTDNFELAPIVWPPKEGQEIWCISATGEVHQRDYEPNSGGSPLWESLVSCYAREDLAITALDTLKRARGL